MKPLFRDASGRTKPLMRLLVFVLAAGVGLVTMLMLFEERFIYFPEKYPGGLWDIKTLSAGDGENPPAIEDCRFVTVDGVHLHGWYCSLPRTGDTLGSSAGAKMVLLFFHGNAGNITYRYDMIRFLMALPVEIFIIDYRGYGKSEGKPTEEGLYVDAQGAWDYLFRERRISAERIILFGKSLGGAVAIDLATRIKPAGLIVQSSFTSIPDMARSILPFFPSFLLSTKMNSLKKIPAVDCPKLFIHSPADEVVPYRQGLRLFEAATEPKEFYEVPRAPHNETYLMGGENYLQALRGFIGSCTPHR